MLRTASRLHSTRRALRNCLAVLLVVSFPGLAQALSSTSLLTDPESGTSVNVIFDDSIDPGNIVISLDIEPSPILSLGADASLTGFFIRVDNAEPELVVSGADVFQNGFFGSTTNADPCPCYSITELGSDGLVDPTGIRSTTLELSASVPLSLAGFDGDTFLVALSIRDSEYGEPKLVKLRGFITVIPEPSTAAFMLLGLMGLSAGSRRTAGTQRAA